MLLHFFQSQGNANIGAKKKIKHILILYHFPKTLIALPNPKSPLSHHFHVHSLIQLVHKKLNSISFISTSWVKPYPCYKNLLILQLATKSLWPLCDTTPSCSLKVTSPKKHFRLAREFFKLLAEIKCFVGMDLMCHPFVLRDKNKSDKKYCGLTNSLKMWISVVSILLLILFI